MQYNIHNFVNEVTPEIGDPVYKGEIPLYMNYNNLQNILKGFRAKTRQGPNKLMTQ